MGLLRPLANDWKKMATRVMWQTIGMNSKVLFNKVELARKRVLRNLLAVKHNIK